jgi:hypothetical protein
MQRIHPRDLFTICFLHSPKTRESTAFTEKGDVTMDAHGSADAIANVYQMNWLKRQPEWAVMASDLFYQ